MKFLIGYTDYQMALQRSEAVGYIEGCRGNVSIYAFGILKRNEVNEWGLAVQDWQEVEITQQERDVLKTLEELQAIDWFPPDILP